MVREIEGKFCVCDEAVNSFLFAFTVSFGQFMHGGLIYISLFYCCIQDA